MSDWQERHHPRDDRGRFRDKDGWAGEAVARMMPGGRRRVVGRDRRDEVDIPRQAALAEAMSAEIQDRGSEWGVRDEGLAEIYEMQGFHARPEVLTELEMDHRITAEGWQQVWRGFGKVGADRQSEYLEAFRSGEEHYPGLGIYGNGTYSATAFSEARQYAEWAVPREGMSFDEQDDAYDDYRTHTGIARIAIDPEARGINYFDLASLFRRERDERNDPVWSRAMGDLGRYAATSGYDYIFMNDDEMGAGQLVILNRSAVAVQGAS